jgi:hypothetical protein
MPSLDPMTLNRLLTMMYINPYVEVFKMAKDMMATKGAPTDLKLHLIASRTKDARRYNVLTANEVAALMVGNGAEAIAGVMSSLFSKLACFSAFPSSMWDTWLYIVHCYFLMMRMDDI